MFDSRSASGTIEIMFDIILFLILIFIHEILILEVGNIIVGDQK